MKLHFKDFFSIIKLVELFLQNYKARGESSIKPKNCFSKEKSVWFFSFKMKRGSIMGLT
jgi:hypothetical protein